MKRILLALFLVFTPALIAPVYTTEAKVNAVAARNDYVGDNSTTIFAYGFGIQDKTHIRVLLNGVAQTVDVDYTVLNVGKEAGGSVAFTVAPGTSVKITLLRSVPHDQQSDYNLNESFPATRIEGDYDKLTMIAQEHAEKLNRAVKLPESSTKTGFDLPDPGLAANQGKFLRIKSDGSGLESAVNTTTGLPTDPAACPSGQFATDLAADGTLTCAAIAAGNLPAGHVDAAGDIADGLCSNGEILKKSGGVWTCAADATGGTPTLDTVGDPAGNKSFSMGGNTLGFASTATTGNIFNYSFTGAGDTLFRGLRLNQNTGNPTGGYLFEAVVTDADMNPATFNDASGNGVEVTGAGALHPKGTGTIKANRTTCTGTDRLLFDGTCDPKGSGVSILDKVATDTTVSNTTTETTVYSFSVTGGTLSTANRLRLVIEGRMEGTNSGELLTIRVKYGATTVFSAVQTDNGSGSDTDVRVRLEILLSGDGATNSQLGSMLIHRIRDALSNPWGTLKGGDGTSAEDSTLAKTLAVTVQWGFASINHIFTMRHAMLEKLE